MKTHEFWRSMQQSKGEELLDQGGWFEVYVLLLPLRISLPS